MRRLSSVAVLLGLAFSCVGAEETVDPFGVAPCAVWNLERPGVDTRYVTKVLRRAYALESPFHVPLNDVRLPIERYNRDHPDADIRILFVGHGSIVIEAEHRPATQSGLVLMLTPWFGREGGASIQCFELRPSEQTHTRILVDPYTGNAFVARMFGTTVDLVVIDPTASEVARVRTDLTSGRPLEDLTGVPFAELEAREPGHPGFLWIDVERLASFVDVYRTIDGDAYGRFIVDTFLLDWYMGMIDERPEIEGMRLPSLPIAENPPGDPSPELLRLRELRSAHSPFFRPKKPRKGGVASGIVPVLKLIEAHDCLQQEPVDTESGHCPAYSAMALETEFLREYAASLALDEGHASSDIFGVIARRGLCQEALYPFPAKARLGWPETVEEFAGAAEKALNRMLRRADPDDLTVARFAEALGARHVSFVDGLPPVCAEEMERFVEERKLAAHDLAELIAFQHEIGGLMDPSHTELLRRAQQEELLDLGARLLADGVPFVALGDGGALENRGVLVYGSEEGGFVTMDVLARTEDTRLRRVVPLAEFENHVTTVTYLRRDFKGRSPTLAQLRRSLHYAPEIEWTQYRIGKLLQDAGRHREAIDAFARALELDPDDPYNWRELAESMEATARFEEAADAFRKSIDLGLDNAYCHASMGLALHKLGRLPDAQRALERALELDPDYRWATHQLGWVLYDTGDLTGAESRFRRALEREPDRCVNYTELAGFLADAGRIEEARRLLLEAAETFSSASDLSAIGHRLYVIGSPADAAPLLERALSLSETETWYRLSLARVHRALGDPVKLAAVLAPVEARLEALSSEWIDLAYVQALLGKEEAARQTIEASSRSEQPDQDTFYDLTCIYALLGDRTRAIDAFERALELGFHDYRWARHDPDLAELIEDPRFRDLLEGSHESAH